eukprot:UN17197
MMFGCVFAKIADLAGLLGKVTVAFLGCSLYYGENENSSFSQ